MTGGTWFASIACMNMRDEHDSFIQDAVISALKSHPDVRATDVGVEVHGGVVTLTGTVHTWAERSAAQEAAHRARGVRDVANEIAVAMPASPHAPTDVEVARAARAELDALQPANAITSSVTEGIVTLNGTVASAAESEALASAVAGARGVRRVQNWIDVVTPPSREKILRERIAHALAAHGEHVARHIDVVVHGNVVKLAGGLDSEAERRAVLGAVRAQTDTELIDGADLQVASNEG